MVLVVSVVIVLKVVVLVVGVVENLVIVLISNTLSMDVDIVRKLTVSFSNVVRVSVRVIEVSDMEKQGDDSVIEVDESSTKVNFSVVVCNSVAVKLIVLL